jgi:signal transduction histidine kinase
LQAIMDAMPVAMFMSRDRECRHAFGNQNAYQLLHEPPGSNLSKSAPAGERPAGFRVRKDGKEIPPHEMPLQKAAATGQAVYDVELELAYPDARRANIIGNAVPLRDAEGSPNGAVAIFVDITERKKTEERLRQAQKLESIGLLAGGIAHDFNNLLTVIMGYAHSALTKYPFYEEARHILTASEQAANLTRQLLAYAGKGQFISETFNLADLVSRYTHLLSASVPRRVKVGFNPSPEETLVKADPSQIEQVLMNLVINAGEAIPPDSGGRIEIATSSCEVTPEMVRPHALAFDAQPGRFVCLEVSDNGSGMDEATLAQIFDPFFSTKFTGRGLGLAAVHGIVRSCKGFIDVRSSPGSGSRFRVWLPAARKKPHPAVPAGAHSGG